jgi:hypothetical protein
MKYRFGHVNPWWDSSFKDLNYIHYPLKNTHDLDRWLQEGYSGFTLNGGLYNMSQEMPDYAQPFFTLFDWSNVGLAFYKMNTMEALPLHQDSYTGYIKMFDITNANQVWRSIVFLEDWKSGHYFEIDGSAHVNWRAGDYVLWNNDVPHYAANIGLEPRYTMQITGTQRK